MKKLFWVLISLVWLPYITFSENGYDLWLRYHPLPDSLVQRYSRIIFSVKVLGDSPTIKAASHELQLAFSGLLKEHKPSFTNDSKSSLIIGSIQNREIRRLIPENDINRCVKEGFIIKTITGKKENVTVITGKTDAGVLYGTFKLIRMIQTGERIDNLDISENPRYDLRLLDHWDNLNGSVERGYAGRSIWWNREESPELILRQYQDYGRANASVGINGCVLNNVNASPQVLLPENIAKFAAIAGILRPYNIRVYMSVNFNSPALLGGLSDSDPLNPAVIEWWKNKVKEIYQTIPDFGGFLVKANSEGQPGPQNFGRSHADGANMLANALRPYNGVVMWRAFVYQPTQEDRAKQACNEFKPLDGKFADNVIIQVKNGPVDFQPREPFSPLFGAMQKTPLMVEFQITQEYLGFSDHLVYLAPLQKECLDSDTWCKGQGSTVARVTDGTLYPCKYTSIAGVANIGRDTNWCGHHFAQANWYAYGRLAWNHQLTAHQICTEWLKMTFSGHPEFLQTATDIMMRSREAAVEYMTPLGLHHLMGWSHHHGPEPWTDIRNARPDWLPRYYHNAGSDGIGFDRTLSGSKAVEQYFSPLKELYDNPKTCPENLLLWFHHLPWTYRLSTGNILWNELCLKYSAGVNEVRAFQKKWDAIEKYVDEQRFSEVQYKLKIQCREAVWWRDACLLYFQTFSGMKFPPGMERPVNDLNDLKKIKVTMSYHN
jgi:alpha-glucuronidase